MPTFLAIVVVAGITVGQIVAFAVMMAIGAWQASQARAAARDAYNASLRDRLISTATTTAYRSRVYGMVRNVDGVLFKGSHGPDSRYYSFVVAIAGHEVYEFVQAYFNDIPLTLAADGNVLTAPYSVKSNDSARLDTSMLAPGQTGVFTLPVDPLPGSVMGCNYTDKDGNTSYSLVKSVVGREVTVEGPAGVQYQTVSGTSMARIRFYRGAPGQDLSHDLVALGMPGIVAGRHRFEGIACMLVTLTYSQDAFPQGVPSMSAVVRGARCADRRTGLTDFTSNPAVIADDWAQYVHGGNLRASDIDADLVIASANACDVAHTFSAKTVDGTAVLQTMPMYEAGTVAHTDADPSTTLVSMVESMAGQWAWAAGKLRIKAGYYSGPIANIDDTWLSDQGSRTFTQGLPQHELANIYNPQIASRDSGYLVVPVAPVRAQAYITLDARELPVSLVMQSVTDVVHAQHVCSVMLRQMRQGFTISLPCNFKGIRLELFDVVTVNLPRFGLVNKVCEVVTWSFSQTGGTTLMLRETAASIYDPDAGFQLLDESPNTALPLPWLVPPLTGLAITSGTQILTDASIVTRTRVAWNRATSESVLQSGKIEVAYLETNPLANVWHTVEVPGDATEAVIVGLKAGAFYIFKIRARSLLNVTSVYSLIVAAVIAAPPTAGDAAAALAAALAATAAAAQAQATATAAQTALAVIADDNMLSVGEKPAVMLDWDELDNSYVPILAQADLYALAGERAAFVTAKTALGTYLTSLQPFAWNDLTPAHNTTIVGVTFRANWAAAYQARQVLLNAIYTKAKALADAAQTTANEAQTTASNAAAAAANAQTNATAALVTLNAMSNDNVLSRAEKSQVIIDWRSYENDLAGMNAQGDAFGHPTEEDVNWQQYQSMAAYLGSLVPAWNDLTQDSPIVGATWRQNWQNLYYRRQLFLNKLADIAATRAAWTNVTNRPLDGNNLVKTPTFEDGAMHTWQGDGVVAVTGVAWSKALQCGHRDVLEGGNFIPVREGEKLYFGADLASRSSNIVRFGYFAFTAAGLASALATGNLVPFAIAAPCNVGPGGGFAWVTGSSIMPAGTVAIVAWVQVEAFSNFGANYAANLYIGRQEKGATIGATWGVDIGGSNKPADNATVGGTLGPGGNIGGQATTGQIGSNAIVAAVSSSVLSAGGDQPVTTARSTYVNLGSITTDPAGQGRVALLMGVSRMTLTNLYFLAWAQFNQVQGTYANPQCDVTFSVRRNGQILLSDSYTAYPADTTALFWAPTLVLDSPGPGVLCNYTLNIDTTSLASRPHYHQITATETLLLELKK